MLDNITYCKAGTLRLTTVGYTDGGPIWSSYLILFIIQVIGLLIYYVYQNMSNNLNERNFITLSVIFFSIDGIPVP